MSSLTTSARRIGAVAVVLLAIVPAAQASVTRESSRADGGVVVLPDALRADRPSGPVTSDAPWSSAHRADRPSAPVTSDYPWTSAYRAGPTVVVVPVAADAADRVAPAARPAAPAAIPTHAAPGRHRTVPVAPDAGDRVQKPAPQAADAPDRVPVAQAPVSADAPDRVPAAQAPANDDGGLSWPTVLIVAFLAAAASVGIAAVLRRTLRGPGTASPSGR